MSRTSSFRLSDELYNRLVQAAHRLDRGKNWIIVRALEDYLNRHETAKLSAAAREQSLLASRDTRAEDEIWLEQADTAGWK